jgi:hypothetical protein
MEHDGFADRGDGDRSAGALEQRDAQKILQLAELRAERGLGYVAPLRGMAEVTEVGHGNEVPQLGERHWLLPLSWTPSINLIYIMD